MMVRVKAIYENGALTLREPLDLEEGAIVLITVTIDPPEESGAEPASEDK